MTIAALPILPGRLGTPNMQLRDDPRADPRMIAAMAALGLDVAGPPAPIDANAPLEQLRAFAAEAEAGFGGAFDALITALPPVRGVTSTTQVIRGVDGNSIKLFIHHPTAARGPMPGMLHIHGGGMVIGAAADAQYVRWRDELAASGMVAIGVEFRNGAGKLGSHPFPAGLNDCTSALQWVTDNKARLGISSLIVSGESGGGNLTLATTLKAKRDGRIDQIDGVYAQCPYICGMYARKPRELMSLHENDDYFIGCALMAMLAKVYDPTGANATNPLAWPYHATPADLRGLPPHVISVNQLDPLRDEGLVYFRKLLDAGVSAVSRTVNGTCHAGDCIFRGAMPEVYAATIRDIKGFAGTLVGS
jgi:acetyl esterase